METLAGFLGVKTPVHSRDVQSIVGNIHVNSSILAAVRHVANRIKGKRKKWLKQPKIHRRYLIAATIHAHLANRIEYQNVISGQFTKTFKPRYFWNKETQTVTIQ